MTSRFGIIEIGSNNTKTHIYEDKKVIYEDTTTIEFKNHYNTEIATEDLNKLYNVIENSFQYTNNIHIYGCSIFRSLSKEELENINEILYRKYRLKINVVSQEDEVYYTAIGCYDEIDYNKTMCIFIGGGGSIELLFVKDKKVIDKKYFDFGVVDITKRFPSLKDDIPMVTFDEVYYYVANLIGDIKVEADILILAGGDHLYWYDNAGYELLENNLYTSSNQKYIITREMSDQYDRNAFVTSLNKIRQSSDNPKWFDGSRAMKVTTNLISHQINAKYIVPTKINMDEGLKIKLSK